MSAFLCFCRRFLQLIGFLAILPAFAEPSPVVGEATLVIGVASIVAEDGASSVVARGTSVHVGDRIETEAGGHVHLRFVDGGRVSVRPASRLLIENYTRSTAGQASPGAIKFRLEEGVVRSITGAWGEAARERFRLNTPVAAIGVKGTDFIARFANGVTYASVYTGAITMTPLNGGCSTTVGPCLNGAERLLAADTPGQVLELARQQATASLIPVADQIARSYVQAQSVVAITAPASASSVVAATVGAATGTAVRTETVANEQQVFTMLQESQKSLPNFSPTGGPQFAWGRWTFNPESPANAPPGDAVSVAMDAARSAGMAAAGISSLDGQYRLFRDPSIPFNIALLQGVKAEFRLAGGAAQLARPGGVVVEPASIDAGSLSVDFSRAAYETSLRVSNRTINAITLGEAGKIDAATGVLRGANTYGAVSGDGTSAAYSFARDLAAGRLSGITLWGR